MVIHVRFQSVAVFKRLLACATPKTPTAVWSFAPSGLCVQAYSADGVTFVSATLPARTFVAYACIEARTVALDAQYMARRLSRLVGAACCDLELDGERLTVRLIAAGGASALVFAARDTYAVSFTAAAKVACSAGVKTAWLIEALERALPADLCVFAIGPNECAVTAAECDTRTHAVTKAREVVQTRFNVRRLLELARALGPGDLVVRLLPEQDGSVLLDAEASMLGCTVRGYLKGAML